MSRKYYQLGVRMSDDLRKVIEKESEKLGLNSSELIRYVMSWYHFRDEQAKRKIVNEGISDLWEIERPKTK